jgi:CubicO group peptidase (beta-lactamase class C family)
MNTMKTGRLLLLGVFILIFNRGVTQGLYFPPLNPAAQWDTVSPASLDWCTGKIPLLYDFLEQENTKGFLVLKDGKIAIEKYFGTFTKDSLWYWASAGKTVTSFLVGAAQEEGYLSVEDQSSKFLGAGWTDCTPLQEGKITIRHQLTMTSGLDDGVPDNHCTLDTCLNYLADPGTRWAYHNAVYTLLEKVLVSSTGKPINTWTQMKLGAKTGIAGFWYTVDYDNVFFSNARSMARFGLLMQNNAAWNGDSLLHDTAYVRQMVNTSQALNYSYGYLWWLNGKSSYMLPTVQYVFPGSYAPNAPADMFAGLGKNGQVVSISPSKGIVMVRIGNQPGSAGSEVPNQLCDQIWQMLNEVMCNSNAVPSLVPGPDRLRVFPNPASRFLTVEKARQHFTVEIFDLAGRLLASGNSVAGKCEIDCRTMKDCVCLVRVTTDNRMIFNQRLIVLKNQ